MIKKHILDSRQFSKLKHLVKVHFNFKCFFNVLTFVWNCILVLRYTVFKQLWRTFRIFYCQKLFFCKNEINSNKQRKSVIVEIVVHVDNKFISHFSSIKSVKSQDFDENYFITNLRSKIFNIRNAFAWRLMRDNHSFGN